MDFALDVLLPHGWNRRCHLDFFITIIGTSDVFEEFHEHAILTSDVSDDLLGTNPHINSISTFFKLFTIWFKSFDNFVLWCLQIIVGSIKSFDGFDLPYFILLDGTKRCAVSGSIPYIFFDFQFLRCNQFVHGCGFLQPVFFRHSFHYSPGVYIHGFSFD